MNRLKKLYLYLLGMPKTIIFNLRYLPLRDAIWLPIFVSHRVWLKKLSGTVRVNEIRTRVIQIEFGDIGIFDEHRSRTIWEVSGAVEFKDEQLLVMEAKYPFQEN